MMTTSIKSKALFRALLSVVLVAGITVAVAPSAQATPRCTTASFVKTCVGATSDGAAYQMIAAANFNGTVFLYSHGYRPWVNIEAGQIPTASLAGGYTVNNLPQPGPLLPGNRTDVITALVAKGYGVVGSGFLRQGWNAESAVKTNVELIKLFKDTYAGTTKVVAWGESLGGFITQALHEAHPELVDAVAPLCAVGGSIEASMKSGGDALWLLKTFFDNTIVGHNYKAGDEGRKQAIADIQKIFALVPQLQASLVTNAWPRTSGAVGTVLAAIPPRSALLLTGLAAGLPGQSNSFDGTTGPGPRDTVDYSRFAIAVSPALAMLENIVEAGVLGVLVTHDLESQLGGAFFDNSATDYGALIEEERVIYNLGLSGEDSIAGMLAVLSNPAVAPRWKANATAAANMKKMLSHKGVFKKPTITMHGIADPAVTAGNLAWFIDRAEAQYRKDLAAGAKNRTAARASRKLLAIINVTVDEYTTFNGPLPVAKAPGTTNGAGHCNFTQEQYLAVAELAAMAAKSGRIPNPAAAGSVIRTSKAKNLIIDRDYFIPLQKFYGGAIAD